MAYSSIQDVRNALSPQGVSDDPNTAASLSDEQITDAISEADGIISIYVGTRYQITQDPVLPLVAVSPVRWWSRTIAAYYIALTWSGSQDLVEDDPIRQRFAQTMLILQAIAKGDLEMGLLPVGQTDTGEVFVVNQYDGDLFTPAMFLLDPRSRMILDMYPVTWPVS